MGLCFLLMKINTKGFKATDGDINFGVSSIWLSKVYTIFNHKYLIPLNLTLSRAAVRLCDCAMWADVLDLSVHSVQLFISGIAKTGFQNSKPKWPFFQVLHQNSFQY